MPTLTTNFNFQKPLVNNPIDADLWGGQLNTNWDDLDALMPYETSLKTADFSVTSSDFNKFFLIDASSAAVTATLPSTAPLNGFVIRFKAIDVTNIITIDGNGNTIDGNASVTIGVSGDGYSLVSDGNNWRVLGYTLASNPTPDALSIATQVKPSSAQSIPNETWTALNFGSENFDDGGWHDNTTNNERITVDADGRYQFFCNFNMGDQNNGDLGVRLMINGAEFTRIMLDSGSTVAAGTRATCLSGITTLSNGDYVEMEVFQQSGSSRNISVSGTFFTLNRIK